MGNGIEFVVNIVVNALDMLEGTPDIKAEVESTLMQDDGEYGGLATVREKIQEFMEAGGEAEDKISDVLDTFDGAAIETIMRCVRIAVKCPKPVEIESDEYISYDVPCEFDFGRFRALAGC